MVNGISSLTVWQEVALLIRLRWRIQRNQLRQKNAKLELVGLIVTGLFFFFFVGVIAFAFYEGAATMTRDNRMSWLALLFWGVLLFWQVFSVFFASLTTVFDFRTLLRFPLHLGAYFVMNVAYGLADPIAMAAVTFLLAIVAGVASVRPELLPAAFAVLLLFAFVNILIERCIGFWIEKLLSKRRTREITFVLMILGMISLQFVVPLFADKSKQILPWLPRVLPFLNGLPPGLAGRALAYAGSADFAACAGNFVALLAWAAPFAGLLWLRLGAQYRGELLLESEARAPAQRTATKTLAKPESSVAGVSALVPGEIAAIIQKELCYLKRNGIAWMNLLLPLLLVLLFTMQSFTQRHHGQIEALSRSSGWFFFGAVGYVLLLVLAPSYNAFAFEGRGLQVFFTAPVRFRSVILAKNLLLLLLIAMEVAAVLVLLRVRGLWPGPQQFVTTLAAMGYIIPAQLTIANWASIAYPRKLEFGSMRNQRASGMTVLILLGTYITLGLSSFVVILAGKWSGNPWVSAGVFLLLAAAATSGYVASLDPLSSFAEKKREVLLDALCK